MSDSPRFRADLRFVLMNIHPFNGFSGVLTQIADYALERADEAAQTGHKQLEKKYRADARKINNLAKSLL